MRRLFLGNVNDTHMTLMNFLIWKEKDIMLTSVIHFVQCELYLETFLFGILVQLLLGGGVVVV